MNNPANNALQKVVRAIEQAMADGMWGSIEVVLQDGQIMLLRQTETTKLYSGDKNHE
jgi:hypothetical protein